MRILDRARLFFASISFLSSGALKFEIKFVHIVQPWQTPCGSGGMIAIGLGAVVSRAGLRRRSPSGGKSQVTGHPQEEGRE